MGMGCGRTRCILAETGFCGACECDCFPGCRLPIVVSTPSTRKHVRSLPLLCERFTPSNDSPVTCSYHARRSLRKASHIAFGILCQWAKALIIPIRRWNARSRHLVPTSGALTQHAPQQQGLYPHYAAPVCSFESASLSCSEEGLRSLAFASAPRCPAAASPCRIAATGEPLSTLNFT